MRVIFMGSPDFAVPTLDALIADLGFDVLRVVTQPDRPKGRGKKLTPTPVKQRALDAGIPVVAMTKREYKEVAADLTTLEPDLVVVAAFGVILRDDILNLPKLGCVNLHASLLPKYRGVSPVQAAILSGDGESGCTTMWMDVGVDTGDMLLRERVPIQPEDTAGTLEAKLAAIGAPLMIKTLEGLRDGSIEPQKQDDSFASYTKKITKDHGRIDWNAAAGAIARRIRAMSPWPTAYTSFGDKRLIILAGREHAATPGDKEEPGTIVSTAPLVVAAGEGCVEVTRVKVAGKKEMDTAAFVAGYRVSGGDRLGRLS